MPGKQHEEVPWRIQAAVYGIGIFSTSIYYIASVVVPLYVHSMNPSPLMFGLVFSVPHLMPLALSIHGGALMDRLGARKVMIACALLGAVVPLLYPVLGSFWAIICLQMLLGLAESIGWLGAQTMIGQYMHGRTHYAGRLSAVIRISHLFAPPMAGLAWDIAGPWGAFLMMSAWASGSVACAIWLPPLPGSGMRGPGGGPPPALRTRDLLPRLSDYLTAFYLLRSPAVVLIVLLGALMHVGNTVQASFYVAWLKEMGITGTAIGLLSPAGAIGAALFSLLTARLTPYVGGLWLVLGSLWAGIVLVCITPLLGSYLWLQLAMFLRSGANGLAQPLIITLVLRGAGRSNQGKAVGLRGTANRIASIVSPLLMGVLAQAAGLETAFYLIGFAVTAIMGVVAVYLWRHPEVARADED